MFEESEIGKMKHVEVVAGIILYKKQILCVQRNENKLQYISKKYEFPGGKMESGETKIETLKREILEELKMKVEVREEFLTVFHEYPDFKLTMHSYICNCKNKKLTLTEHIDFKWLDKAHIANLDWAAADIPIVNKLINFEL